MTLFMDRFIAHTCNDAPEFCQKIKGAGVEEIARLEQLAGRPLPASYIDYLAHMGRATGGLYVTGDASPHIESLLQCYEEEAGNDEMFAPDCLWIGVDGVMTEQVGLQFAPSLAEPRVVAAASAVVQGTIAESLEKLLYRLAFKKFRQTKWSCEVSLSASMRDLGCRRVLESATELAKTLGFETLWFSDSATICAESELAALTMSQHENSGLAMFLKARDQTTLDEIGAAFIQEFDVHAITLPSRTYAPYGTAE